MSHVARQVQLTAYPDGKIGPEHFQVVEVPLPALEEGEVLVRNQFTSCDPGMRLRLRESGPAGYFAAVPAERSRWTGS